MKTTYRGHYMEINTHRKYYMKNIYIYIYEIHYIEDII